MCPLVGNCWKLHWRSGTKSPSIVGVSNLQYPQTGQGIPKLPGYYRNQTSRVPHLFLREVVELADTINLDSTIPPLGIGPVKIKVYSGIETKRMYILSKRMYILSKRMYILSK